MHRNRDLLHEMGLRELLHGKIDAHVQRRILRTALLPFTNLPAAFLKNPFADRHDGSGSFGHRDKIRRRDQAESWMLPSQECFKPRNLAGLQRDDGLILQHQLVALNGVAQIALNLRLPLQAYARSTIKNLIAILAQLLCSVHCHVRVTQQFISIHIFVGAQRDADTCCNRQVSPRQVERFFELFHQPLHGRKGVVHVVEVIKQDRKFVATQTRNRVTGANRRAKPLTEFDEQLIANQVAQNVINALESVEIEEKDRKCALLSALPTRERFPDLINEQGTIGQTCESIVQGLVHQLFLCTFAVADVLNLKNQTGRIVVRFGDLGDAKEDPDGVAIIPQTALLKFDRGNGSLEQVYDLLLHPIGVFRMSDGTDIGCQQLIFRASENLTERLVDLQPISAGCGETHPGRLVERRAKELLTLFQSYCESVSFTALPTSAIAKIDARQSHDRQE